MAHAVARCLHCLDDGLVCENHPRFPWESTVEGHRADCGGAGMPCPFCCSDIPADGTHSIAEAFTPDWKRAACASGSESRASGLAATDGK